MRNGRRLGRLQRLKQRIERLRRFELAAQLAEQEQRRAAVDEADRLLAEARRGWQLALRQGVHADDWQRLLSYIDHLARSRAHRQSRLGESDPLVAKARGRLQEAGREREALTRLVERWQQERRREDDRRERRALDEVGRREVWQRGGGHEERDLQVRGDLDGG
jgi:flagellar export protein FliJ